MSINLNQFPSVFMCIIIWFCLGDIGFSFTLNIHSKLRTNPLKSILDSIVKDAVKFECDIIIPNEDNTFFFVSYGTSDEVLIM